MAESAEKPKTMISGRAIAQVAANRYGGMLRRYLSRHLKSRHDVEDVAQSVLLKLVRINDDDLIIEKPGGFIRTLAIRAVFDLGQKRQREWKVIEPNTNGIVESAVDEHTVEGPGNDLDLAAALEVLKRKSPTLAAAVALVSQEGCSYAEAAERLGISEDAIKKQLLRARAILRCFLCPTGEGS